MTQTDPRPVLCALLALSAAACSGEDQDDTGTSSDTAPPGVETLAACDEVDLDVVPFMGPAFDPETGALLAPLPVPHLVATTVGWSDPAHPDRAVLEEQTNLVIADLFTHEGLLGASFGMSEGCRSARTLSIWRDEAALLGFATGPVHSEAIQTALSATQGWETTHWTETGSDQPPTWDDARGHLDAVRSR